jgi:hypothetical protein
MLPPAANNTLFTGKNSTFHIIIEKPVETGINGSHLSAGV